VATMPRTVRRRLAFALGVLLILGAGPCHSSDDATATGAMSATGTKKPVLEPTDPLSRNRLKPEKNLYHMPKFSNPKLKPGTLFSPVETDRHHRS
jgi:hypothetical protein